MSNINPSRMIPLHIADQAVAACEAEIQKLKEENAQLKHKLGRLLGAEQEWTLVEPEHYAKLKSEVERLTERLNRHLEINDELNNRCTRLRDAGDELAYWIGSYEWPERIILEWNAAKEGKQS